MTRTVKKEKEGGRIDREESAWKIYVLSEWCFFTSQNQHV